jgi:hypothetical protein
MNQSDTSETGQDSSSRDRVKQWVLLDANRWTIIGLLFLAVFSSLVVLATVSPTPITELLQLEDPIHTAFQGLIPGIITGATLVLTINQLVLSQELGPLGSQRERMQGAMDFRQNIEEKTELAVSPLEVSTFFRALIEASERKAAVLRDTVDANTNEEAYEAVTTYVDGMIEDAQNVSEQLENSQFGTFEVVGAALEYNYSRMIHRGRQIQSAHIDSLSEDTNEAFDELIAVLRFVGPAREHFKTHYFQWELINLSYAILYTSVPAIVVAFGMILFFDPGGMTGTIWGIESVLLVVCIAAAIGVVPFIVLLAYILRIATIAKRTLAIGPFILQETEEYEEIQWEE